MPGIIENRQAPLFLYQLAHKVRAVLEEPGLRSKAEKIVCASITRQRKENWADTNARTRLRSEILEWHSSGCDGPKPMQIESLVNTELGIAAEDWPFPLELGIEESPGSICALVAVNDFAAANSKLFHRNGREFTPIWSEFMTGPSTVFYLYWTQAVDLVSTDHEKLLSLVVQCAIDELSATPAVSSYLVTLRDMANLAGIVEKTIRNRLSLARKSSAKVPEPVQKSIGAAPAQFNYLDLRSVLIESLPKRAACFPE